MCAWRTRLAPRGAPCSGTEPSEVPGGAGALLFARAPSCSLPLRGLGKGAGTSGGAVQPGGQRWGGEGCSGTGRAVCVSPRCFPAVDKMSLGPVPLSSTSLGALLAGICVENPSPALRLVADVRNWAERHQIKLRAALQARSALPGLLPPSSGGTPRSPGGRCPYGLGAHQGGDTATGFWVGKCLSRGARGLLPALPLHPPGGCPEPPPPEPTGALGTCQEELPAPLKKVRPPPLLRDTSARCPFHSPSQKQTPPHPCPSSAALQPSPL